MKQVIPEKIFVVYDNGTATTACAATTMNEAIKLAIRYMYSRDYVVNAFVYGDSFTTIDYGRSYRVGPDIQEEEGKISIMATRFFEPE